MKKILLLFCAAAMLLAGCSEDDPADPATTTDSTNPTDLPDTPDTPDLAPGTDITADFDPLFAQALQKCGYITDADKITFAEVKGIKELEVVGFDLTSLRGIEYFESLTKLVCYLSQLTSLDMSKNTALTLLSCGGNQLTALDVSKNTALTDLSCGENRLTALDVSKNTALTYLNCANNQLTALDVSKNTALRDLLCYSNQLTALDISKNTALTYLNCYRNPGDGTVFPVTAWFDNNTIPSKFSATESWTYNGATITVDYRKAE